MADLVEDNPSIVSIKLEGVPTPLRVGQTLKIVRPGVTVLGGLGGTYFLDELRHGARGTMTGFAYPEILVDMWSDWSNARATAAADLYRRYLPILILESQAGISLSIRKELLRRRGWIAHAVVRRPGPELDALTLRDIEATCSYLELGQSYVRN
jgi:4-hydroxy-tetrahydrodipicolinate synthase